MTKKLTMAMLAAAVLMLVPMANPASAQAVGECNLSAPTSEILASEACVGVLPDEVETPTETDTPTEVEVEPDEVTQEQPVVAGDVIRRPLPRTGNDIGGTAIFGGALTILGVGLALTARKRRNSFDGV